MQAGVHFNVVDSLLHGQHFAQIRDGLERMQRIVANAFAQDFPLSFVRRVTHLDAHQKAIELRFGQGISAMMLDGVLRGHNEKRLRKRLRLAVHADLCFVHCFK